MTEIDPFAGTVETPRMLPYFATKNGLRMIYVDAAGRHHCLAMSIADLTRVINSAAMALEIATRERSIPDQINEIVDRIMATGRDPVPADRRSPLEHERDS